MSVPFVMVPATDQTGSFAINLDLGEIGALLVTARKVWLSQLGDTGHLKAIAASVRRHLKIKPSKKPKPTPEPVPQKKLLILCENSADATTAQSMTFGRPPMAVITSPALDALRTPEGIEKIAAALRDRKIVACLLITASGEGPGPAVADLWSNLENVVRRNGVLDIVTLRQDGQIKVVKTNVTRLAQLDKDSAATHPAARPPETRNLTPIHGDRAETNRWPSRLITGSHWRTTYLPSRWPPSGDPKDAPARSPTPVQ